MAPCGVTVTIPMGRSSQWKTAPGGCVRRQLVNRVLLLEWGRPPRESYLRIPAEVILTSRCMVKVQVGSGLCNRPQEERQRIAGGRSDRCKLN